MLRRNSMLSRYLLRLRRFFGYVPNVEWMRVGMSREVTLDRARAHAAISELERCITLRRTGAACARFAA
jgi:hypothetical protein